MEFKRRVLKLKAYGTECSVDYPTVHAMSAFQDASKGKDDSGSIKAMKAFLVDLGLPESVYNKLEIPHLNELIEELSGTKKN